MRSINIIVIILFALWASWLLNFSASANAGENVLQDQGIIQSKKEITYDNNSIKEQEIVILPFYQIRKKDLNVWTEQILVTFLMKLPKDCSNCDLNSPNYRKMLYEMLQSGESETAIQARVMSTINWQLGRDTRGEIKISRSVIIVH